MALKVVLCPAVRVRGDDSPLILKPAPLTVACETVTLPVRWPRPGVQVRVTV